MHRLRLRVLRAVLVALLLLGATGCGPDLHPVHGRVTFPDGNPVTEGLVVFESKQGDRLIMARGQIQPDGRYQLGTYKPGDGALPGEYRIQVVPKVDLNAIDGPGKGPPFDERYREFATSGLTFAVKAGTNEYPIQVTRPAKGERRHGS